MRISLLSPAIVIIMWQAMAVHMAAQTTSTLASSWRERAPRDEIRPIFTFDATGGPLHTGSLRITHDHREGLDGWYENSFDVKGGNWYAFRALRKTTAVRSPRHSALVRIRWQDDSGNFVAADLPAAQIKELGHTPSAEPEYPRDGATDSDGWTDVAGTYRAPTDARHAVVELHLQWAPGGSIEWSQPEFTPTEPPPGRKVRLASIHYKPRGKSPRENCEEYAPLVAEAAQRAAQLVVLGETVPSVSVQRRLDEVAEPIPGPTTQYFGDLAQRHRLHIVLSLNERAAHQIFNTAVLIGPTGEVVGTYRKVCLPPAEAASGVSPGDRYPVFDTSLGRVGMMVCYDGFFPEVARELANRGAEIIAWPVWGCNPLLAQARACENHVYLVSSTYMQPSDRWMISAIFDPMGSPVAQAKAWREVVVAEVDLAQPAIGPYNLGDFRAMLPRHRPELRNDGVAER